MAEIAGLIDRAEVDRLPAEIHAAEEGEPAWPPSALFKALLLAVWCDPSDVRRAEALDDRASFRRFCGFAADEPTPERTAFVRFRRALVGRGLGRALFEAVTDQLQSRGGVVKTGTPVDATLIAPASVKAGGEARWAGHRRKKPVHGYKAHVATDGDGGLVRSIEITTANVHDAPPLAALLPPEPGEVCADGAYGGADRSTQAILSRGGRTRGWCTPIPGAGRRRWRGSRPGTRPCALAVRCRIEEVFGTWKKSYGLRRMRWLGLAKAGLQVRLTAIAHNLRRSVTILRAREA